MACSLCRGEIYGPCPGCSAGRRSPLSDADFQAKLARIREAGAERLQAAALRDEASVWLGPETEAEENATSITADTGAAGLSRLAEKLGAYGDGRMPIRGDHTGRPLAAARRVGGERQAEARGYRRALDASLQAAHQSLKEIGEQSGLTVADVLRLAHEALAENRDRLGVEAGVVTRKDG